MREEEIKQLEIDKIHWRDLYREQLEKNKRLEQENEKLKEELERYKKQYEHTMGED